ncbi:MAG: flagellar hook-basal body complex protein FliE [Proteobacteria bacterium]|nr:flagellar hook-basal body complex protein FliE [Pseudomonadota bacterium]
MFIGGKAALPLSVPTGSTPDARKAAPGGFGTILEGMIKDVHNLQTEANQQIMKVQTEESGSIHEVMIAMEKADISFRTMMQVRNKLLEAYQEVMRLQV